MLKWSIMKPPVNGWDDQDCSQQLVQQLLQSQSDVTSVLPCLVKVVKQQQQQKQQDRKDLFKSMSNLRQQQPQQDDIWLVLHKYHANYIQAVCCDTNSSIDRKPLAIPANYDGLFSFVINNRRLAKTYTTIREMEGDLRKSNHIVLLKPCIGFTIIDNGISSSSSPSDRTKSSSKRSSNQYRIHKIDDGCTLKFDKFCFIETSKCTDIFTDEQHHMNSNTNGDPDGDLPTYTTSSSNSNNNNNFSSEMYSDLYNNIPALASSNNSSTINSTKSSSNSSTRRSILSTIFSNFAKTVPPSSPAPHLTSAHSTISLSKTVQQKNNNTSTGSFKSTAIQQQQNTTCLCAGSQSTQQLSPSYCRTAKRQQLLNNDHYPSTTSSSTKSSTKSAKIIRVMKCHDTNTNAIVYLRDSSCGEFLIDDSQSSTEQQRAMSTKFLYDIHTILTRKSELDMLFDFDVYNCFDIESVCKRNGSKQTGIFQRFTVDYSTLLAHTPNQACVCIFDVNKNKFNEYFIKTLLASTTAKQLKFYKSTKESELLYKFKEKLDWCCKKLDEFKADIKVIVKQTGDLQLDYFEQQASVVLQTASDAVDIKFRRHAPITVSLPIKTTTTTVTATTDNSNNNRDMMYEYKTDTILQHRNYSSVKSKLELYDDQGELSDLSVDATDQMVANKKVERSRFRKLIKFATTTNRSKTPRSRTPFDIVASYMPPPPPTVQAQTQPSPSTSVPLISDSYLNRYMSDENTAPTITTTSSSSSSARHHQRHLSTAADTDLKRNNRRSDLDLINLNFSNYDPEQISNRNSANLDEFFYKNIKHVNKTRPTLMGAMTPINGSTVDLNTNMNKNMQVTDRHNLLYLNKFYSNNTSDTSDCLHASNSTLATNLHASTSTLKDVNGASGYYKRSIQNLLNINKRPKTPTAAMSVNNVFTRSHKYENRNFEVTAI